MDTLPMPPSPKVLRLAGDWSSGESGPEGASESLPWVVTTWQCPTCRVQYAGTVRQIVQAIRLVLVCRSGASVLIGTGCQLCQEACPDPDFPTVGMALSQLVPERCCEDLVAPRSPHFLGERPIPTADRREADGK